MRGKMAVAKLSDTVGITATLSVAVRAPRNIYTVTKPDIVTCPSYSPHTNLIIFCEKLGATWYISTVRPDGTTRTVLQSGSSEYADPHYSEDGAHIVFSVNTGAVSGPHPQGQWALKYMNSDGTGLTTILNDGNANIHPTWMTPTQVAFQNWQYGATPSSAFQISYIDLAGQGRTDLGTGEYPRVVIQ